MLADWGATIRRVPLAELPIEVAQTLARIRAGEPFLYPQDGYTFFNRENRLPRRSADHYREYTVETSGSHDRGARRLIVGGAGAEVYYTDDHYGTFCQVVGADG